MELFVQFFFFWSISTKPVESGGFLRFSKGGKTSSLIFSPPISGAVSWSSRERGTGRGGVGIGGRRDLTVDPTWVVSTDTVVEPVLSFSFVSSLERPGGDRPLQKEHGGSREAVSSRVSGGGDGPFPRVPIPLLLRPPSPVRDSVRRPLLLPCRPSSSFRPLPTPNPVLRSFVSTRLQTSEWSDKEVPARGRIRHKWSSTGWNTTTDRNVRYRKHSFIDFPSGRRKWPLSPSKEL